MNRGFAALLAVNIKNEMHSTRKKVCIAHYLYVRVYIYIYIYIYVYIVTMLLFILLLSLQ